MSHQNLDLGGLDLIETIKMSFRVITFLFDSRFIPRRHSPPRPHRRHPLRYHRSPRWRRWPGCRWTAVRTAPAGRLLLLGLGIGMEVEEEAE